MVKITKDMFKPKGNGQNNITLDAVVSSADNGNSSTAAQPPSAPAVIIPKPDIDEWQTYFPIFKTQLKPDEYIIPPMMRATLSYIGLKGIFSSSSDITKKAISRKGLASRSNPETILYTSPEEVPDDLVQRLNSDIIPLTKLSEYQKAVDWALLWQGLSTPLAFLEATLAGHKFRNEMSKTEKAKPDGHLHSPYDALMHGEAILHTAQLVGSGAQMYKVQFEDEGFIKRISEITMNPWVQRNVFYGLVMWVGIPYSADLIEAGHPIDRAIKDATKFSQFFVSDRIPRAIAAPVAAVGQHAIRYEADAAKTLQGTVDIVSSKNDHPLKNYLANMVGEEITIFERVGALGIRLAHTAMAKKPIPAHLAARAAWYHMIQKRLQGVTYLEEIYS